MTKGSICGLLQKGLTFWSNTPTSFEKSQPFFSLLKKLMATLRHWKWVSYREKKVVCVCVYVFLCVCVRFLFINNNGECNDGVFFSIHTQKDIKRKIMSKAETVTNWQRPKGISCNTQKEKKTSNFEPKFQKIHNF